MSEIDDAIQGLMARRGDLVEEVERRRMDLLHLNKQMDALDLVATMFDPPQRNMLVFPQYRKEVSRLIFEALRAADRPMTSVELSDRVLIARRVPAEDRETRAEIRRRVRASLAHHRRKGILRCQKGKAGLNEWTVI